MTTCQAADGLSAGTAGSLAQTYDRAGNVTSESRSLTGVSGDAGGGTQSFAYDGLSRLTGSSGLDSGSVAYTYDLDGNRTSVTTGGVTRLAAYDRTDALAAISIGGVPVSATLDALGNLVTDPEIGIGTATVAYAYGGRGSPTHAPRCRRITGLGVGPRRPSRQPGPSPRVLVEGPWAGR